MRNLPIYIIIVLAVYLNSCATYSTMNSNNWFEYELPPSKISLNGKSFFVGKLSDGSWFYVFYDREIEKDAKFYYVILQQNFGWKLNDGVWTAPKSARDHKNGHIYINPRRRVAVYFHPSGNYSVYKVQINNG